MPLPRAVVADGNLKVLFVTTLADPANPTVAELTAPSVVDLSCYLTQYAPSTNQGTVNDNRLCTRVTLEKPGKKTEGLQTTYVYNQAEPDQNEAELTLVEGTIGYFVSRWGVPYDDAIAAGDIVDVHPSESGPQVKLEGAENETFKISQKQFVYDLLERSVEVVA